VLNNTPIADLNPNLAQAKAELAVLAIPKETVSLRAFCLEESGQGAGTPDGNWDNGGGWFSFARSTGGNTPTPRPAVRALTRRLIRAPSRLWVLGRVEWPVFGPSQSRQQETAMMMCRLTVLAPEGAWQDEVSSWTSLVVMAALSAEPESLDELAEALRRYQPEHEFFDQARPTVGEVAVVDEPWCLIDLVGAHGGGGRLVGVPRLRGAYKAEEDDHAEGLSLLLARHARGLADSEAGDDWQAVVAARSAAPAAVPRLDARPVLFGQPLLEHLAAGVLAGAAQGAVDEKRQRELTRAIHAAWLMTTRADLGGRTPRELLLAHRAPHLLGHGASRAAVEHAKPPRPTVVNTLAGLSLRRLWDHGSGPLFRPGARAAGPGVRSWCARASRSRRWSSACRVARGLAECAARRWPADPAQLIESERRRLPVASQGEHLFDDCPICQASEEMGVGPTFMSFDGHHLELEDESPSRCTSPAKNGKKSRRNIGDFPRRWTVEMSERAARKDEGPLGGSVWQRSFRQLGRAGRLLAPAGAPGAGFFRSRS